MPARARAKDNNNDKMLPRNPFFRAGLPLLVLMVGGSVGLSMMVGGKIEGQERRSNAQTMTSREWNEKEEYEKMRKKLAKSWETTGNLEMKRIDREAERKD